MVKSSFEIVGPEDNQDEYWDGDFQDDDNAEDEEAFDGRPQPANGLNGHHTNGDNGLNGHHTKKKHMKKMKVSTQRDYSGSSLQELLYLPPRARGICCLGMIGFGLILIFIALIVPKSELGLAGHNNDDNNSNNQESTCQVHTTQETFSEWMHNIRITNSTELCQKEIASSDCKCHNPFKVAQSDQKGWHKIFESNLQALNETTLKEASLDLVLYGDSIIERMNGRVFGKPKDDLQDQFSVTKEYFTKEGGGKINALPLGIAGEQIHALMYRLKNGEMPDTLKPGAWWLMIGTNDVVQANCNVDAVVAGIVTVAEEILRRDEINRQYDASHVVINSLFPRVKLDKDPLWKTIQQINSRLECYAETTKGMEFFNATELFLDSATNKVNANIFLEDGIHLTAHGTRLWEEAIVEKSLYLIAHNS
ncbi:Lipolytic protein G-D-S-L family [Seminavis robusta]|uniref:Lipolytic protein G-D-S-L family n=1 Tax=Seminavis robusta TaxID=568900 RepID=A0A9N8EEK9_9STRA|nr:Lipolytic protein G-D-S-L family [Seminavis robusta]|eukprot:Sro1011_g231000.1 Lipolytic protein G-D-S-L family (422) ;mRNA; f:8687-10412